ncbi:hypothetical protein PVK06_043501 [Gossypium arboreum]|uniref:Uncharacterized protein n=1 Tax=Gossypium arboreum TaxID=29729 RepID=A0ABR0MQE2_GOSAR|nr:hypothetical protein PVK06_043501 [Gossypium arboreum]
MSERVSAVIYYDGEVRDTENGVIFLSESRARLVFNQNIDFTELRKRIRRKIFRTTPMKVLSIKYQFFTSVDPNTQPLPDTPLVGGKTRKCPCLVAVWNTQPYTTFRWWMGHAPRRKDDVLLTKSTGEGTSFVADDSGSDDESDVDPPREPDLDGTEVGLFSEPELIPTIPEDVEGGSDEEEEDPRFRAYSPSAHMHNVDLSQNDALEFPDLPHRRRDRTSVSQDHPKMDSDMIASLILPTLNADPKTSVSVLIANIRSQLKYTPSYRKVWIAKQKALEKMHGRWDASYNEVWQWCRVLERYVPSCITDLETTPAYYNDRLLNGCQVFKRLFWSFKQCRDTFIYCKPLEQNDGTFMYGRYTHQLLLAVAHDGSERFKFHFSICISFPFLDLFTPYGFYLSWSTSSHTDLKYIEFVSAFIAIF